jgi:hypothetical protein
MKLTIVTAAATALVIAGSAGLQAQTTSSTRIPIHKDMPATSDTAAGTYVPPADAMATGMTMPDTLEWYAPTGTTCSTVDPAAAAAVQIKSDLYDASTMISPDSAKIVALCAVPGQIGSGEMNMGNGRTEYAIDIIPNGKKTHTKVIVDAETGAVLSSKQFGGLRGLAGWARESLEHKKNTKP